MPLGNPSAGASFAAEFQSSALPWVTSSVGTGGVQEWDFNYVTRFVNIVNSSTGSLKLGFTSFGVQNTNYVNVASGQSLIWEWRCGKIFIDAPSGAAYSLAVGLTTVPVANFPVLSSSWIDGTAWAGVG